MKKMQLISKSYAGNSYDKCYLRLPQRLNFREQSENFSFMPNMLQCYQVNRNQESQSVQNTSGMQLGIRQLVTEIRSCISGCDTKNI